MSAGAETLVRDTRERSLADFLAEEVSKQAKEIKDPLTRELIAELANANSPIWADELPKSKFSKSRQLAQLYYLDDQKIAHSEMAKHGNSLVRKFHITDFGRKVATKIRAES
jgi:hypothetical protein